MAKKLGKLKKLKIKKPKLKLSKKKTSKLKEKVDDIEKTFVEKQNKIVQGLIGFIIFLFGAMVGHQYAYRKCQLGKFAVNAASSVAQSRGFHLPSMSSFRTPSYGSPSPPYR